MTLDEKMSSPRGLVGGGIGASGTARVAEVGEVRAGGRARETALAEEGGREGVGWEVEDVEVVERDRECCLGGCGGVELAGRSSSSSPLATAGALMTGDSGGLAGGLLIAPLPTDLIDKVLTDSSLHPDDPLVLLLNRPPCPPPTPGLPGRDPAPDPVELAEFVRLNNGASGRKNGGTTLLGHQGSQAVSDRGLVLR